MRRTRVTSKSNEDAQKDAANLAQKDENIGNGDRKQKEVKAGAGAVSEGLPDGKKKGKKRGSPQIKAKQTYACNGGKYPCGKTLDESENSIMCDGCEMWFHPSCQNISDDAFWARDEYDLCFLCCKCRPKVKSLGRAETESVIISSIEESEKRILQAINEKSVDGGSKAKLDQKLDLLEQ